MDCPRFAAGSCSLLPGVAITPTTCERCRKQWTEGQPPTCESLTPILIRLQPSRGLGDTIAKITNATGIAAAAHLVSRVTGVPCGCAERQARWNEAIPYKPPETPAE